eukprot:3226855-Alexandrium_andersonii.AAC.1
METCTEHVDVDIAPAHAGGDTPVHAAPAISREEIARVTKYNVETKSGQISVPGALRNKLRDSVKNFRKWIDH